MMGHPHVEKAKAPYEAVKTHIPAQLHLGSFSITIIYSLASPIMTMTHGQSRPSLIICIVLSTHVPMMWPCGECRPGRVIAA